MTRIAFVQRNLNENLGVMYLSACLKKAGHQTDCFIEAEERDLVKAVKAYNPDVVGFTVISGMHRWAVETAGKLKDARNIIVFGGPHPTFFPDVIREECVDVICVGEGEYAMVELADGFPDMKKISGIRNLHVKYGGTVVKNELRCLVADLDELPLPDREIFYKYRSLRTNSRKTVMSSRGCPYSCTFCFNSSYRKLYGGKGRYVRFRSREKVIEEILELKRKYVLKSVFFQDDTFILDKRWLIGLFEEYRRRVSLPFTCLLRADLVDEEIIKSLKGAGCVCVQFGIESGNEGLRNKILKKGVTDEQIIETARLLKKYKIKFKTYNRLHLPHETLEQAFETVELNSRINADYPWASIFLPYPKTELTEYMISEKLLSSEYNVDDLSVTFFNMKNPSREEWPYLNLQRLFFYAVKFPVLVPLIRRLIRIRPNRVFDLLFFLSHAYNYRGSENMSVPDVIYFGLKSLRTSF